MDLVESGAIFNFKPFNPQISRDNGKDETLNSSSRSASRTNSRFEELFLASPRAQELVSTIDQSLSFSTSRSRIISPNKQQNHLHESLLHTPLSATNMSNVTNSGSLIVNMLDCFRSGQPKCQENPSLTSWFSPVKASNYDEDSLRTQVTDVINKLRTPIDRSRRKKDDDRVSLSLNTDSGYDDRQMQNCNDSVDDSIGKRGRLSSLTTSNNPQHILPGLALQLGEENNNQGSVRVPEPDVAEEDEDVDVGEDIKQQNSVETENVELTQKNLSKSKEEYMECDVLPELGTLEIPDIPETRQAKEEIKEPIPAEVKPSKKPHHLFEWRIKANGTKLGAGIIVEGQRREDPVGELWHSTGIVNRVSSSQVETKSKSQYVLEGEIMAKETLEQGFSKQFVEAFSDGFPSNWEQLVNEHFDSIMDTSLTKDEQPQTADEQPQKARRSRKALPKTSKTPKNAGLKPIEVELKRTSSGRLIKPPLAWWRGQRIVTDGQHNLTAIEPGGEEHTALSVGMYDFDLKLPKKKVSLLQSTPMTPKVAKFDIAKTTSSRRNGRSILMMSYKPRSAREHPRKNVLSNTEASSLESSEIESTDATSSSKRKSDGFTSEKTGTLYTDSDASSFPKVMRPKLTLSEESWKPSDSDSTAMISTKNIIPKSRRRQEKGDTKLTRTRKQHSELSTEESADNEEEEEQDDDVEVLTKDHVKRNISFSDDDFDSKSSPKKTIQKKGSFTNLNKKERTKRVTNSGKPRKEMKVVLEKNHRLTRNMKQSNDYTNDDDSDALNSGQDVLRTNTLVKESSKFRKPEVYTRDYKKRNSKDHSCTESSSEENAQPRRSLRKRKQANQEGQRNNKLNIKIDHGEHQRYDSHGTRTRDSSKKGTSFPEVEEEGTASSSDEEEAQAVADMLSNVRRRKEVAESQANEVTSDDDSPKKKLRNQTGRRNQRSKYGSTQDKNPQKQKDMGTRDDMDERDWKDHEIFRLSEALHSIPLSTPRFWQKVSESVETKTAQECQLKYDEQLNLRPRKVMVKPKEKQPAPKANHKVVAITGGVGTIKRKRALRQLVQQNNDGYEDDIFESTPYKNSQKKFKFFSDEKEEDSDAEDGDEDDDDDDNDGDDEEHDHMNFKTPSSRTPSSRYRPLGPGGSSENTPGSDFISPSLLQPVNREGMDHYIHRMKQVKKGVGQYRKQDKIKVVKTSTPKKKATPLIPKTDASIFDVQEVLEQDSEEENDYYWSDE